MKIFFLPMDAHGHVNACIGLARMLKDFGHQCVFAVPKRWCKPIEEYDFKVEILDDPTVPDDEDTQKKWGTFMNKYAHTYSKSPKEQFVELIVPASVAFIDYVKIINDQLPALLESTNPDFIIIDFYVTVPSVINSGKPWALLYSCNPLRAYDGPNVPPYGFGLPIDTDQATTMSYKMFMAEAMKDVKSSFDEWLVSKGVTPEPFAIMKPSPYLNVYPFPADLDYTEIGPVPDKWFRLDHMVRKVQDGPLGFDEKFFDRPGKKIFFSLGSMGAADIELMKRLIGILGKSKHLFIVSKGPFHDKYELAENMVGGKYLNQMAILPRVDLVIHHGGNNTFVETLYFGKPFIVLPLFADQHDNGRRAEDKKIGRSFRPHHVTEDELLSAIDELLNDKELHDRVTKIGENIRNSKSIEDFNNKIEIIVAEHK
ncbi:uncharacterized UDP-glucosyltransferase YjiC-like [Tetranychus urticae]|uniref:UDP-glycosyltransferase 203A3 n=1 Tax=Tetranychus urticae TaxID=32264 RepID=T1K7Z1_TETUR|nr:uncharacterized UDP-glucosyltransferase YjiC-like [Tetranychus urticae]AHX56893.1 UDP-glycosyltransferase 203A3 [Tetranychus urticae]